MIPLEKAYKTIFDNLPKPEVVEIPVEDSIGFILSENVKSTVMMPPFNKSAVDGYACKSREVRNIPAELRCIGLIEAGDAFKVKPGKNECVKIMTGSAVPGGFDSVVMIEDTTSDGERVIIKKKPKKGANIAQKGEDLQKGVVILKKGDTVSGPEVMMAASVGRRKIRVYKKPEISVLNTGNEIVNPPRKLSGNKIFNCNGPLLVSMLKDLRLKVNYLGIAKDREPVLYKKIITGLRSDILVISGGVSVGDYDLVPSILRKAGVEILFHTVKIKPGKPMLFGKKGGTIVFGLPGNPNANFLACHLFIFPAVNRMMGGDGFTPKMLQGVLGEDYYQKTGRRHFVLTNIDRVEETFILRPVRSHGSADVASLHEADGFMMLDESISSFKKGAKVPFITWKQYR